jgi:hypothetical protein
MIHCLTKRICCKKGEAINDPRVKCAVSKVRSARAVANNAREQLDASLAAIEMVSKRSVIESRIKSSAAGSLADPCS